MEEGVQNRQKTRQRQGLDLELGVAGFTLGKRGLVQGWALLSDELQKRSARLLGEPSRQPGNIPEELPGVLESRTSKHVHQHSAVLGKKNNSPSAAGGHNLNQ